MLLQHRMYYSNEFELNFRITQIMIQRVVFYVHTRALPVSPQSLVPPLPTSYSWKLRTLQGRIRPAEMRLSWEIKIDVFHVHAGLFGFQPSDINYSEYVSHLLSPNYRRFKLLKLQTFMVHHTLEKCKQCLEKQTTLLICALVLL